MVICRRVIPNSVDTNVCYYPNDLVMSISLWQDLLECEGKMCPKVRLFKNLVSWDGGWAGGGGEGEGGVSLCGH